MTHWLDGTNTNGGVEDRVVLGLEPWGVNHVAVLTNVVDDCLDGLLRVSETVKGEWDGLVDDLHRTASR